ncbi:adenylosuccinate synthase [Spiroplasma endosymbiont of Crioceris asparagi]|uniref:adenylosuccinate synthase n=1 Tax=Spiroplasma endosymbiont of Crioceris asparagi TaxID=3066286 RepID=UPI0030D1DACD
MKTKYETLVIVGAQWGDEGKGKMTDVFAQKSDIVVRFAGGDNAGHIINFEGQKHKVTIVPSGIFNPKVISIIGNGCVINLKNLVNEYNQLKLTGVKLGKLLISDRAHLILPFHLEIDAAQEDKRGADKIGTTKKGIGPTYQDKVNRSGIRIGEIKLPNFKERLKASVDEKNEILTKIYNSNKLEFDKIYNEIINSYEQIKDCIIDTGEFLDREINAGKKVLFEGAQGVLLDIDHGTYPFVTSSNTSANNVATGCGISNKQVNKVYGVVKAYNTRVGAGAFPTELLNEIGDGIRERGHEYGSNTGRPRRVGWFDAAALRYAKRVGGLDEIFVTLLDVLSGIDELNICVDYKLNGKIIQSVPANNEDYLKVEPIYLTLKGWQEDITKVKSFKELPPKAQEYLTLIEKYGNIKLAGFSVGPDRKQTIIY